MRGQKLIISQHAFREDYSTILPLSRSFTRHHFLAIVGIFNNVGETSGESDNKALDVVLLYHMFSPTPTLPPLLLRRGGTKGVRSTPKQAISGSINQIS